VIFLKVVRLSRGLTQNELAVLTKNGVHQTLISLYEKERLLPTATQLEAMARVLGVSPPDILLRSVSPVATPDDIREVTISHA